MSSRILVAQSSADDAADGEEKQRELQDKAYAMELVNMSAVPMVLSTVIELNILEIIRRAGRNAKLSPAQIASQIPMNKNPQAPMMIDRMLSLLAAFNIVSCDEDSTAADGRLYGLAPVAKYFVRNEDGVSLGPLLGLNQDKVFMDSWYKLKDAVLEGGSPFDMVHGKKDAFEYSKNDSRFHQIYNEAMSNHTTIFVKEMLEKYKGFEGAKTVVDVGGGLGTAINLITSKYPYIKGINFDLPHVIQHAPSYPRVQHVGGDMFESIPGGDVIFMKWILHELSDEQCLKLLKNCQKALPKKGKVVVVEAILPIYLWTNFSIRSHCGMDMMTMTRNPQGRERRQMDWLNLATSAGFAWCPAAFVFNNHPVMEFIKM